LLSERKNTILQSLIQEYVISAHPVASSTLARYYMPLISAATVRNELNWLEHQGYVVSPHTSAGRMPTTVGYRTFVNSLLLHPQPSTVYAQRRNWQKADVQSATVAEPAFVDRSVPSVSMPTAATPFATLAAAPDKLAAVSEVLTLLADQNKGLMVFWAPQLSSAVIHRGLPLLLSQPEFAETSSALPIMQLLESHGELMAIFKDIVSADGLHIKIGSEHRDAQLYEFSLVAMRFDCAHLSLTAMSSMASSASAGKNYGVVALFGPTRMDYGRAIRSISSLVRDLESPANRQRG
jgi:transcriptional regulator of heat shock response